MDTLVKRLRKEQQWGNSLDGEAADRIERLEAKQAQFRWALTMAMAHINADEPMKNEYRVAMLNADVAELEANDD